MHSGACGAPNVPGPSEKSLHPTARQGRAGCLFGPSGHIPVPGPRPVHHVFFTVPTVLFTVAIVFFT